MHHIAIQIINDDETDSSLDDSGDFFYDDVGDREVFMQMWRGSMNPNSSPNDSDDSDQNASISSIQRAYEHMKSAINDIRAIQSLVQKVSAKKDVGIKQVQRRDANFQQQSDISIFAEKAAQLEDCGNFLLSSAAKLREEVASSKNYFRSLAELSKRFPLRLIGDKEEDKTQVSVATSYHSKTAIVINEGQNGLQWSLSDSSRFSFNSNHFEFNDVPSNYLRCFFELMCHELFERIKNDRIKSAIHYSASKNKRSVYFDVGNRETKPWVFELGEEKEATNEINQNPQDNKVPVWIPRLIDLIMDPQAQPATFMRQLLFFKSTLDSISNAFCDRFLSADFCSVFKKTAKCKAAFQIGSPYLYNPYLAFIDKWRVSMTETPNELRCIPYPTDGRGLTPALEKWCDVSYSTLFLAMAERVTRSFGFVFKNKNQYGTATIGNKKIKFTPQPKTNDVEIIITARNKKTIKWNSIPGTDHIAKMCVIIFQDLTP